MVACRAAYFPKGMKLSEPEDLTYFGNSDSDSSFDSDSDSGTDTDEDEPILTFPPQVMILLTPMIIPMKLFGLRGPRCVGNGPCL